MILRYLRNLSVSRLVLWCYLVWYLNVLARYFDASFTLWLNSVGISAIVGTALYLSTAHGQATKMSLDGWQIVRLYLMPFCVSSFASLIKGRGFILVFHPNLHDNLVAFATCAAFGGMVTLARATNARAV